MMMMINRQHQQHPTVEIPPTWDPPYDEHPTIFSPQTNDYFSALHRFLPSSDEYDDELSQIGDDVDESLFDSFSCDNFRMYEFKIRKCVRGRSHDWTECPYAHPGEKARRRDPRKYHYSGTACPDFRRGCCRKGDTCEFAHGVFECWLHPARYRTQPCKDGGFCKRRVCFFAHSPEQLRVLPHSESPPSRLGQLGGEFGGGGGKLSMGMGVSPVSVMDCPGSPTSPSYGDSVSELVNSMRGLQMSRSPRGGCGGGGWSVGGSGFGSPRSPSGLMQMGGYFGGGSIPSTPTRTPTRSGLGLFDPWEVSLDEEIPMERVESGKDLRAKIYAKLSKENSLDRDRVDSVSSGPDFGWVSELVK